MMRMAALTDKVTVYNRIDTGTPDDYGDPTYTDDGGTTVPAAVHPLLATEDEVLRDTTVSLFVVTLAPTVVVDAQSRIDWKSQAYEVVGVPQVFTYRLGNHHIELVIRRIEG